MDVIEARGIVKDGSVILDEPLNVPDGTEVHIEAYLPDTEPFDFRQAQRAVLAFVTDPVLRTKLEQEFDLAEPQ